MEEMKIHCLYDKLVNVSELLPHPKNFNRHPESQIERLAKILKYQGWRYPIKVSKRSGFITSGHGRLASARLNKWLEVPVNYQEYESEEQEIADLVSDNSLADWSELDLSMVNAEMVNLGPDFQIELFGLKDFQLNLTDTFEMPEIEKEDSEKKFLLEVNLPNELELRDLYDDLISKGYVVREKAK